MNLRRSVKQFLRMCGHAVSSSVHERLDWLERNAEGMEIHLNSLEEGQSALLHAAIHSVETLHAMASHKIVDTAQCPECALIALVYSYLPSRKGAALSARTGEWLASNGFAIGEVEDEDVGLACAEVEDQLEERVRTMRRLGYPWHIVVYQSGGGFAYYANQSARAARNGSAFFFREYEVFAQALAWCAATLTPTYFRPGIRQS